MYSGRSESELEELAKGEFEEGKDIYTPFFDYEGFDLYCTVEDKIFKAGYIITDKTIDAGIFNTEPSVKSDRTLYEMYSAYRDVPTEDKAKSEELDGRNLLIIDNEKVDLK